MRVVIWERGFVGGGRIWVPVELEIMRLDV